MEVAALSQDLLALKSPDNSIAVIDVRDGGMQTQWLHPPLDAPYGNGTPLTCHSPHRSHRRAHQGLPLGALAPVRRVAAHPPAPAPGYQDSRLPLCPFETAWAQRRPAIHTRARGKVRRGLGRCARRHRHAGPAGISSSTSRRTTRTTRRGRCGKDSPCRAEGVRSQGRLSEVAGVPWP